MRIVLTGGGTGGHVYPALTLWRYLQRQHPAADVLYIGTEQGLERDIVVRAGLPFVAIEAAGLKRQLSLSALRTGLSTYRGYQAAKRILRDFQPDVVVGTGGFVTLPVVYAAHQRHIPTVIWEANVRPGLTNKLCARRADVVAVSFPESAPLFGAAKKVVMTGHPRASEVLEVTADMERAARIEYGLDPRSRLIVLFAGSRGAETVNEIMLELLPRLAQQPDWQLLYVTGERHFPAIDQRATGRPDNVRIVPYVHDMPAVLRQTDVLIARAGGATLAEICAFGLASILIPSPYVTANHQEENAHRLVDHGAARMIRESDLTANRLWDELTSLLDGGDVSVRRNARDLAAPNAVGDLYQVVLDVMKRAH